MKKETLGKNDEHKDYIEIKKMARKKIPKEISQEILKKIFLNLIIAIFVMIYFAVLNFAYTKIQQEFLLSGLEICSGILLVISLVMFEISYKKDSGAIAIASIEVLVLSFHSLSVKHVITMYEYQLQIYLLTSSYIFCIYYLFKSVFLYTKGRKNYLKTLSDIPEIVKKDKPIVKEAKKRSEQEDGKKVTKKEINKKPKSIKRGKSKKKNEENSKVEKNENKKKTTKKKSETKQKEEKKKEKVKTKNKKSKKEE